MDTARTELIEKRLEEIRDAVAALGPILVGNILTGRNRKVRKDGSVYVSKPYYSFQYRDAAGRRVQRRVPRGAKADVAGMVAQGRRFTELQAEYAALSNELSLLPGGGKKNAAR
jgi:hypothetical protein